MLYGDLTPALREGLLSPETERLLTLALNRCASLPDGRYPLEGEHYCLVQTYDTHPRAQADYEHHERYRDVQILLQGAEEIDVTPTEALTGWRALDPEKDIAFCEAAETPVTLRMAPLQFALLDPADAHRPGCSPETAGVTRVRKLVVKLRL